MERPDADTKYADFNGLTSFIASAICFICDSFKGSLVFCLKNIDLILLLSFVPKNEHIEISKRPVG